MSLWSERGVLDRCSELQKLGVVFSLAPGAHLARGFADVGYEEFCLLPSGHLASLFTASAAELRDEERRFFFVVPSVDEVREELDRRGWDIVTLESPERRGWKMLLSQAPGGRDISVSAPTLLETFLEALIKVSIEGKG
jgi:hypothetical protein